MEYGSSIWDPYTQGLQEELEKVQNCAARFVTRNYFYFYFYFATPNSQLLTITGRVPENQVLESQCLPYNAERQER